MSTTPNTAPAGIPGKIPAKKSGSLLPWLLGILGTGVVVLCLITFAIVSFFVHGSRFDKKGSQVSISTPLGGIEVKHGTDPGLPKYPGATDEREGASFELTGLDDDKLEIVAAHYFTLDSLNEVDSWYAKTLGGEFERKGPGQEIKVNSYPRTRMESSETAYVSDRKDTVRLVKLNQKASGVEIKLVRIGPRATQ